MRMIVTTIFILLYLFQFGSSLPTQTIYELPDFEMCAEADILQIENLKGELFKLIPLQEITGKKEDISFGLLNEDWVRLDELAKRLPKDSILKSRLVKAFRLLIAALYQAHSKPIFQQCYDQRITTSKDNLLIQGNRSSHNISNPTTDSLKDSNNLGGGEGMNWPIHKTFTTQTVKLVLDDIDNVAAGSDNEETEVSYPYATPNDNLNNSSTPTFHNTSYDRNSIDETSTQKNTLNLSSKPKLQSTTENNTPPFDITGSKVETLNNVGLDNITSSSISSYTFTTTSSAVVTQNESTDAFGNHESASSVYVQTDKYISNVPYFTAVNKKPVTPFDTDLNEIYPESKKLANEDNADIIKSTNDPYEIASLFPTKNLDVDVKSTKLRKFDAAPKEKTKGFIVNDYSETVNDLFESSTLPFSTSKPDSSEYKEIDIDPEEEHTTGSKIVTTLTDQELGPTTSSLSNIGNVTPFSIKPMSSQDILEYENITESSTYSYKSYTSTITSHSSHQNKEDNIFTESKTTGTSTTQFHEYSTDGPSNDQNISEITLNNTNFPDEKSTTKYVSRPTYSNGIESNIHNNKEILVQPIGTENLPSTISSFSKIKKMPSMQPSPSTFDLNIYNINNAENYQPTVTVPIFKTTTKLVNGFIQENMIPNDFNLKPTTKATEVTKDNDRTSSNSIPKIITTNSYSQEYYNFSTSQSTLLNITLDIVPDQDISNTETPTSPKTYTVWTTMTPKTSTIWTTKSPKTALPFYFDNPLYDENSKDANQKGFPAVDTDIDFPEGKNGLDNFESENEQLPIVKPTETYKDFTVLFKKLSKSHEAEIHTNTLSIYPKGEYPKRRPQQKILTSCRNSNQCVQVENHPYLYPARFYKKDQVINSNSVYNMPNHNIKSYEVPIKPYPKYFATSGGKGFHWFPKPVMVRLKTEER